MYDAQQAYRLRAFHSEGPSGGLFFFFLPESDARNKAHHISSSSLDDMGSFHGWMACGCLFYFSLKRKYGG